MGMSDGRAVQMDETGSVTSGRDGPGRAMSWPGHITDVGGIRRQFHHIIDIVPAILEANRLVIAAGRDDAAAGSGSVRQGFLALQYGRRW
jgi:hypothetical protein